MHHGKNIVAGERVTGAGTFRSEPVAGEPLEFSGATEALVDDACRAAEAAFESYGQAGIETRAALLEAIAEGIEARGEEITRAATSETGLPEARIQGERGRTVGQLRLFAAHIRSGEHLDRRHDEAMPDRAPLPRPDLKMVQRPMGPVAVFGASNFPLAFSVAGGDTASALAAGCTVVVKGHPAHPETCEIVGEAIAEAVAGMDLHPGVFSLVQGGDVAIGTALVTHPLIRAVGFTGSLKGGRALFDLCAQRPEPIPFFGELGSVNPVFVLDGALRNRGREIGAAWAGSLTMGAGQFCTNPGIVVLREGPSADAFVEAAEAALREVPAQVMLTSAIAGAYAKGKAALAALVGVETRVDGTDGARDAEPTVMEVSAADFLANGEMAEEVFGPLGLVVRVGDDAQMMEVARSLDGQLTCTLQIDDGDEPAGRALMPILERKAGRILANGFPTGVEVAGAMVHGGPYPASTNFGHTSVGTLAIRRWLRPVCYQDMPEALLPEDLRT